MKVFEWNHEKNKKLQQDRTVTFEMVLIAIEAGYILEVLIHPNQKKYPNQQIIIVEIENYAYCVPATIEKDKNFLKTIYPSRKDTKEFLDKNEDE